MKEEWKPVNGYERIYEISNYGRVKALDRTWTMWTGGTYRKKGCYLKVKDNGNGYKLYSLHKNGKEKNFYAHILVYNHFGKEQRKDIKPHIDHINDDKAKNRIDNLQPLSQRENVLKSFLSRKTKNKYRGVNQGSQNSWQARILINGKRICLGSFPTEYEAHLAYEKALTDVRQV